MTLENNSFMALVLIGSQLILSQVTNSSSYLCKNLQTGLIFIVLSAGAKHYKYRDTYFYFA
jgi:hypothetical protein